MHQIESPPYWHDLTPCKTHSLYICLSADGHGKHISHPKIPVRQRERQVVQSLCAHNTRSEPRQTLLSKTIHTSRGRYLHLQRRSGTACHRACKSCTPCKHTSRNACRTRLQHTTSDMFRPCYRFCVVMHTHRSRIHGIYIIHSLCCRRTRSRTRSSHRCKLGARV